MSHSRSPALRRAARSALVLLPLLPLLLAAGCGDGGDGGGTPNTQPCGGTCTADQVCVTNHANQDECVTRECRDPDLPCSDPSTECVGYRCLGKVCHGDGPPCGDEYYCDPALLRCAKGCRVGHCPGGQYCNTGQHVCLDGCEAGGCGDGQFCEPQSHFCRACDCQASSECAVDEYCATLDVATGDCRCHRGCRGGEGQDNCTAVDQRCDPATHACTDWICTGDEQCYASEYCRADEFDVQHCFAGCRGDASCPDGQVCYQHTCQAVVRCANDDDCAAQLPGTRCDTTVDPPLCHPLLCPGGDDDCPRQPQLYYCTAEQICAPGDCRVDADCANPLLRCGPDHSCAARTCTSNDQCDALGEYCNPQSQPGTCLPGCWHNEQCPGTQPCLAQLHACGCHADGDCAALAAAAEATLVCDDTLSCVPACTGHEQCAAERYCDPTGHCLVGCRPDRFEPDEVQGEAAALPLVEDPAAGTAHLREEGLHLCGGGGGQDNDWYFVQLGAGDLLQVDLDWAGCALGQLRLSLWREQREAQQDSEEGADGRCHVHYLAAPAAVDGPVDLQVEGLDRVDLEYALELTVTRSFDCRPDALEPDDAPAAAHRPDAACVEQLTLCAGDEDWFAFTLQAGDRLQVQVTYDGARGDIAGELDLPQAAGAALSQGAGHDGTLELTLDSDQTVLPGDYLLRLTPQVEGLVSVETGYRFCWQATPAAAPCTPDVLEPDDTRATAQNLFAGRLGAGVYSAAGLGQLSLCAGDEDWYYVDVAAPATLHAGAHNDPGPDGDRLIELELYQGELLIGESRSDTRDNQIDADLPAAGSYHLRVVHPLFHDQDETAYALSVALTVSDQGSCVADRLEPNGAVAQATPLQFVAGQLGTLDNLTLCAPPAVPPDEDWFRLDLRGTNPNQLHVAIHFSAAQGDLDLALRDAQDGNPCAMASDCYSQGQGDDEQIDLVQLQPQLYLAKVYCAGEETPCHDSYRLEWQVGVEICHDDAYEPNPDAAGARGLDVNHGRPYSLHLCANDEDWFALRAPGGQDVEVLLDHHFFEGNLLLQVLDANLQVIGSSGDQIADRECVVAPQPAQGAQLYVRVYGAEPGVANDYTLGFQIGDGLVCAQ